MEHEDYSKKLEQEKESKGLITKDRFYQLHAVCPKCFKYTATTIMAFSETPDKDYIDDINKAFCDFEIGGCGWKGKIIDLVPERS